MNSNIYKNIISSTRNSRKSDIKSKLRKKNIKNK